MNIFIPNVSMMPQHRAANLVIKSILLQTESIENLINLKVHGGPPLLDPSGCVYTLGFPVGGPTVATILSSETHSMCGKRIRTVISLRER